MASGHGVSKPDKALHPNRRGDRVSQGYTNLVSGVTHTITEGGGERVEQQAFVDPMGNMTPAHARAAERESASMYAGYHKLPFGS